MSLLRGEDVEQARRISAKLHPSRQWVPLKMIDKGDEKDHVWDYWQNDLYGVSVRRYNSGSPMEPVNGSPLMVYIGVCSADGSARHDWRDLQKIKNQVTCDEWEAVELYPAESRLVDPSNLFILWAFPSIPIGMTNRLVMNPMTAIAPQRGWHPEDEPKDCVR